METTQCLVCISIDAGVLVLSLEAASVPASLKIPVAELSIVPPLSCPSTPGGKA